MDVNYYFKFHGNQDDHQICQPMLYEVLILDVMNVVPNEHDFVLYIPDLVSCRCDLVSYIGDLVLCIGDLASCIGNLVLHVRDFV